MNEVIASNVRRFREQRNWTQEELADKAGRDVRTIQRVEKGEKVSKQVLVEIAGALGISLDELQTDVVQEVAKMFGVAPHELTPEFVAKKIEEHKAKYMRVPLSIVQKAADLQVGFNAVSMLFECIVNDEAVQDLADCCSSV
jgi:transcriptional regulator with XRE-family HTH domain